MSTNLFLNGKPAKQNKFGGYVVDAIVSGDVGDDIPVIVTFDYQGGSPDRPNPDRPNPGPGMPESLELTSVTRKADHQEMDLAQFEIDEADWIEAVEQRNGWFEDVAWLRKMAGI